MITVLFLLLYIVVPVFLCLFLRKNKINLTETNIITIVFWFYLCFSYIGILPLFFHWDSYRFAIGITEQTIIFQVLLYSSVSLILIMLSCMFVLKVLSKRLFNHNNILEQTNNKSLNKNQLIGMAALLIISSLVFLLYLSKIPEIPIIAQLKGYPITDIKRFRSLATNDFAGKFHMYSLFFDTMYTFVTFTFFANLLIKRSRLNLVLFSISFLCTSFAAIQSTQKAPMVWVIIGLVLVYFVVSQKTIKPKSIVLAAVAPLVILFLFYKYFMGMQGRNAIEIFTAIFSRTFTGQISPSYWYLEIFPNIKDFLWGASLPNPRGIFPWEHYRITVEVMNYQFPDLAEKGIVGSAPTVFWAEAYANFGILGVVIASLYIGILLGILYWVFIKMDKSAINVGAYVWMILEFKNIALTGISNYLWNIDMFSIIFLFLLFNISDIKEMLTKRISFHKV